MGKPASLRPIARTVFVASALASLLLVSALAVTGEDFPPTITVTIDEDDQFQTMDVSIGQALVTIRGTVQVEKDSVTQETIKVTIQGTRWDGSVNEITEQVRGATPSFDFTLYMTIPAGEVEGTYSGQVVAVWTSSTGEMRVEKTDDFQVRVVNTPFTIDANPVIMTADPSDTKYVTITINDRSLTGLTYLVQVGKVTSPDPGDWIEWAVARLDANRFEVRSGESVTVTLEIEIPANATTGTMVVPVVITVEGHPEYTRPLEVSVMVQGVPIKPPEPIEDTWLDIDPMLLFTIAMMAAAIGFIGFFGFTEVGLLFIMWGLLMPLFTRLKKKEVLNQFTRGQIYGFIKANPGVHLTSIKENLGLANGVLAYHLKVLIREEFLIARREGGYKRFYPRDMRVPRKRVHFTRLQLDIVEKLSMHPGTTQVSLARMLGESKQVINYNVGVLVAAGVIRVEREGSRTLLFVEDATSLRPQVQVAELVEEGTDDEEATSRGTPSPVRWQ
jgi:predicted transcriptional regulator